LVRTALFPFFFTQNASQLSLKKLTCEKTATIFIGDYGYFDHMNVYQSILD
jgi:hypothetical protein